MPRIALAVLLVMSLAVVAAQESPEGPDDDPIVITERGSATEIAPGITVIIDPLSDSPMVVAQEIFYYPHFLEPTIRYDQDYTTFFIDLASRETTRIFIEVTDSHNLVPRTDEVIVPAGSRISAGFAAFAPHAGVIRLSNEEGQVLAEVPYNITKQSRLQHTISGFASASVESDFDNAAVSPVAMGVAYGIQERSTGIGANFSLEYSTDGTLSGRGSVSGSYSW